jgi:hydrogenase nickel incorporation protein HypA/HybF
MKAQGSTDREGAAQFKGPDLMHELSIAQGLLELLREEMEKAGAVKLRSVRLEVGGLSGVVPEALSFGFQVVAAGTELEGAELIMDFIPVRCACRECGGRFEVDNCDFRCPACGGSAVETLSGRELSVKEITVD